VKWYFWIFIAIFLALYGLINYYVGLRGWQYLFRYLPGLSGWLYWSLFWIVVWSNVAVQIGKRFFPYQVGLVLTWVGAYWMGMMFYSLLIIAALDLVRIVAGWTGLIPGEGVFFLGYDRLLALGILMIVIGIQVYGTWNANHTQMRSYEITIPKAAGPLQNLRVLMVSDIHLGKIVGERRLEKLVQLINDRNPGLVLLVGDTVDGNVDVFSEQKIDDCFLKLRSKYGAYAVLGNHEYISREVDETILHLEKAGVRVLRDEALMVADSFYLVGRDDASGKNFSRSGRKELSQLMHEVDGNFPVILLDHQPQNLGEAEKLGVDLQVSGHTHRGQLFPNNWITARIFENDWGYLRKGNLQVIVSSGYGTWGPPIRIGSRSEVVEILMHFQPHGQKS